MLCGKGAVASWPEEATSFHARVPAAPSSVLPKSTRLQNINKIPWPFPQQLLCSSESQHRKASLSLHWSLCLPAEPKRSQPTWLSHHIWACYRLKEVFFFHDAGLLGRNECSLWRSTHDFHVLDAESELYHLVLLLMLQYYFLPNLKRICLEDLLSVIQVGL